MKKITSPMLALLLLPVCAAASVPTKQSDVARQSAMAIPRQMLFSEVSAIDTPDQPRDQTIDVAKNQVWAKLEGTTSTGSGLTAVIDRGALLERKKGFPCMNLPLSGVAVSFKVDKNIIPSSENNLLFQFTYLDVGFQDIYFYYNSEKEANKRVVLMRNNTRRWITSTIVATDARLAGTGTGGTDFRITSAQDGLYLRDAGISTGVKDPNKEPVVAGPFGGPNSEMTGKSFAGLQSWFRPAETGSWIHLSINKQPPTPGNSKIDIYPDISEYPESALHQTGYANFGDGRPAELYEGNNSDVLNIQMRWAKEYGIDGMAVQRFIHQRKQIILNNDGEILAKTQKACEKNGVLFSVNYDIAGALEEDFVDALKLDWVYNIEQTGILKSSSYATVNGKPVVMFWCFGAGGSRPGTPEQILELIRWFKSRGCYVWGGLPREWRTTNTKNPRGVNPGFEDVFKKLDMISPWHSGGYSGLSGADTYYKKTFTLDKAWCDKNGIDLAPVLWPGFSFANWYVRATPPVVFNSHPRLAGEFLWRQAYNAYELGVKTLFLGMFDEFDEGTNWAKAASDSFMIPTDQYFVTYSADGVWCSPDYYLRMAGTIAKMFKGEIPATKGNPVPHSLGPIYYRNSFEKMNAKTATGTIMVENVDPCFYRDKTIAAEGVNDASCAIIENPKDVKKTGAYLVEVKGSATGAAKYEYLISETKITVSPTAALSFFKYNVNNSGKGVTVGVQLNNGEIVYAERTGATKSWTKVTLNLSQYAGKTITGIVVSYEQNGNGKFLAYIDDVIIQEQYINQLK